MDIVFDHERMVVDGALANGQDLRLVANNRVIPIALDPASLFGKTTTRVWFRATPDALTGNLYIYYANPSATDEAADLDSVFNYADDFEDGELDARLSTSTQFGGQVTESGGELGVEVADTADAATVFLAAPLPADRDFEIRVRARAPNVGTAGEFVHVMRLVVREEEPFSGNSVQVNDELHVSDMTFHDNGLSLVQSDGRYWHDDLSMWQLGNSFFGDRTSTYDFRTLSTNSTIVLSVAELDGTAVSESSAISWDASTVGSTVWVTVSEPYTDVYGSTSVRLDWLLLRSPVVSNTFDLAPIETLAEQ